MEYSLSSLITVFLGQQGQQLSEPVHSGM